MFKKIKIQNFRGIKSLEIDDFKQVNLFVGGNNSGKTSVLEALQICFNRNLLEQVILLNNSVRYFGLDLNNLGTIFEKSEAIKKHLKSAYYQSSFFDNKNGAIKVELSCNINDIDESVNLFSDKTFNKLHSVFSINNQEQQESAIVFPALKEKAPEIKVSEWLQENIRNNSFYFDNSLVVSGIEIIKILYAKVIENESEKDLVRFLQKADSNIKDIQFDGQIFYVDILNGETSYRIDGRLMGEGIKKIFVLALVVLSQDIHGGVLLIDEIESGLHYTYQQKLWNWLFKIAKEKNIQIFATTHSMDCVKSFVEANKNIHGEGSDNQRLYRLVKKTNDEIKARKYDGEVLDGWLNEPWELR